MQSIEKIRKRAKAWRDIEGHDKAFCLQVFMHGDVSAIQEGRGLDAYAPSRHGAADLPDYGEINLKLGPMGIQNHGEVNSRINIQGLVHVQPVLNWMTNDAKAKGNNQAWVQQSWTEADWGAAFYMAGMEYEAQGLGAVEWGPDPSGRIVNFHRPYLDTIVDRMYPSPHQWRGVYHRRRIDLDEALELYGHLYDEKELEAMCTEYLPVKSNVRGTTQTGSARKDTVKVIHEWNYQDVESQVFFLKSIADGPAHGYDENGILEIITGDKPGPNPHGFIPWSWWVDSYLPSNMRPRGKSETVIRLATMINELEMYMVEVVERGLQLLGVSDKADPAFIEAVQNAKGAKDISKMFAIVGAGNIQELLSKLPPDSIPEAVIMLRGILKDELNAATGVMDMQRGQELQRDRVTRYEVQTLRSMQGVQARHMRERYARFLEQGIQIARALGAMHDDRPRLLQTDTGTIDTAYFPINVHLAMPILCRADPETMYYLSDDEKRQRAIEEFQAIKMPAIELGVADPYQTMYRLYQQVGYTDPVAEGLLSMAQYQMLQEQMAMMQALGMGQEEQNGSSGSNQNSGGGKARPKQNGNPTGKSNGQASAKAGAGSR